MGPFKRNLPNFLSGLRVVLIIPFILALRRNDYLVIIVAAATILLTDYLDGQLARAWNVISKTGKILDPLADKISTALAALSLVYYRGFPVWLLALILGRDIVILMAGLAILRIRHVVPVSDIIGKITMVVIAVCLVIYLFNIKVLMSLAAVVTVLALISSVVSYGIRFWRLVGGDTV